MKRHFLYGSLLLSALCSTLSVQASEWNAIVSQTPQQGQFATIAQALDAAPANGAPWRILIHDGVWQERLVINKAVTLIGQSSEGTIIEANTPAGALGADGKPVGTSRTSTVDIRASGVTMENLTVRNSFDFPANSALPADDPRKITQTQAVALMVSDNADHARFRHIRLEGYQDTFYSKTGSRSYFTDCAISGHVDFIFGAGIAVFEACDIIARNREDRKAPLGYVTAPSTSINQQYGLIFLNSRITKEPGVPAKSFALGRPWHPTTNFADGRYADPNAIGLSAFIGCEIDDHIYGWDKMSGRDKDGNTIWFHPEDSRFYEFDNRGPGAGSGGAHYQLTQEQAARFNIPDILSGWSEAQLKR